MYADYNVYFLLLVSLKHKSANGNYIDMLCYEAYIPYNVFHLLISRSNKIPVILSTRLNMVRNEDIRLRLTCCKSQSRLPKTCKLNARNIAIDYV